MDHLAGREVMDGAGDRTSTPSRRPSRHRDVECHPLSEDTPCSPASIPGHRVLTQIKKAAPPSFLRYRAQSTRFSFSGKTIFWRILGNRTRLIGGKEAGSLTMPGQEEQKPDKLGLHFWREMKSTHVPRAPLSTRVSTARSHGEHSVLKEARGM